LASHGQLPKLKRSLVTLPLWTPTPVGLGAVGYLSKPAGKFITLFNSFDPDKSSDGYAKKLPSLHGYGRVMEASDRQDKRSITQRGIDAIQGLFTFKNASEDPLSCVILFSSFFSGWE
jgi:abelson tyrosine-protein kinase 1